MLNACRLNGRVVSWLDSAPSPSDLARDGLTATPAGAARAVAPANVLLFVHAFPVSAEMWRAQIAAAPAGWRFLAPDLRGFGQSEGPAGADDAGDEHLSLDDYARDILALLDHLAVERAVIAGLSMGGYSAFALLRLARERVRGLVLANAKAEADTAEARKGRAAMVALVEREGVAAVADQMLPRLLGETTRRTRPDLVEQVRAMVLGSSARGVRDAVVRMMNRPDSTPMLAGIECPTLVVASDEDHVTPADPARAMARSIPGADFALVEAAGHLSNLERPDQFNQILSRFVTSHFGG